MRIVIPCMHCLAELGHPDLWFAKVEFRDDGRYEVECRRGHRSVTILQEEKYEVLFEIGANAILDGYYREATASFAAALERFYEFAVTILLEEAGVASDASVSAWKIVASSSERQLGAFALLWLLRFKEAPVVLENRSVSFRNDVIHKGRIPTREEAVQFGDAVLDVIFPKLARLRADLAASLNRVTGKTLRSRRSSQDSAAPVATMTIRTAFRTVRHHGTPPPTMGRYLKEVAEARAVLDGADA